MSSCLIIMQGNKMYIGADTACSIKAEDGYRRFSDDMPKLFSLGQSVFFCSGRKSDAEKCVSWIYDNFKTEIDIKKLEHYLKDVIVSNDDNVFNVEFLLCDYNNHKVIQLSQYNDFKPMIYNCSDELRILCGGYKTKDSFLIAKKNLILNKSVREIYKDVFESISDECVGGKVILYNSPTSFEVISLEETNIKYANNDKELFLLTSDFVTSGVVNGSQIIGGDIYSQNYVPKQKGTYFDLINGDFQLAGGNFLYDSSNGKLKITGVDIDWSTSTTPKITDINGLHDTLITQSASITANANAITAEVTRSKGAEEDLSSSITQTATTITSKVNAVEKNLSDNYSTTTQMNSAITQSATNITSTVSATYETKTNASAKYSSFQSQISQNATNINLKVSASDLVKEINNQIDIGTDAITISGNKLIVDSTNFKLTSNGNVTVTGKVTATEGKIGGWTIASTYIGASVDGVGSIYITSPGDSNYWIRTHNAANGGGTRTFSVSKAGQLYARGAEISGKLTAGSGSILGADSYIGSSGSGWKITNNQIHTVKTTTFNVNGTNVTQPLLTLSAGSDASGTYLYAPNYFQIGGALDGVGNIGANFVGKVFIGGDCSITGNCNITGVATASNLTITGGTIKISNNSTGDAFQVTSNGYTHIKKGVLGNGTLGLFVVDKGIETQSKNNRIFTILGIPIEDTTGKVFYAIISVYDANEHTYVYEAGITKDGWRTYTH